MADDRTMAKRKSLSIAGAAAVVFVVLLLAQGAFDSASTVGSLLQLVAFTALVVTLLAGGNAGWLYWQDWYRR